MPKETKISEALRATDKEAFLSAASQIADTDNLLHLYRGGRFVGLLSGERLSSSTLESLEVDESPIGMLIYSGPLACSFDSFVISPRERN